MVCNDLFLISIYNTCTKTIQNENKLNGKKLQKKRKRKRKRKQKKGYLVLVGYTTGTRGGRPRTQPVTPLVPVGIRNRD
jgi:hypothetical protein